MKYCIPNILHAIQLFHRLVDLYTLTCYRSLIFLMKSMEGMQKFNITSVDFHVTYIFIARGLKW